MAQHPSLKSGRKRKRHRSVLKRFERIKTLKEKNKWEDGNSVFGLAKVKMIRIKLKKEKAAVAEGEVAPAAQAPSAEGTGPAAPAPEKKKEAPKKEKGSRKGKEK